MKPSEQIYKRASQRQELPTPHDALLVSILEYLDSQHAAPPAASDTGAGPDDEEGARRMYEDAKQHAPRPVQMRTWADERLVWLPFWLAAYRFVKSESAQAIAALESLKGEYQRGFESRGQDLERVCKVLCGGALDGVLECDPVTLAELTMEKLAALRTENESLARTCEARSNTIRRLEKELGEAREKLAAWEPGVRLAIATCGKDWSEKDYDGICAWNDSLSAEHRPEAKP